MTILLMGLGIEAVFFFFLSFFNWLICQSFLLFFIFFFLSCFRVLHRCVLIRGWVKLYKIFDGFSSNILLYLPLYMLSTLKGELNYTLRNRKKR